MAPTAATITSARRPGFQPPRGESPLGRAQRLRAAGRSAEAKLAYAAVIDADPAQPDALLGLAALLMSSGEDIPQAQRLLERCCSLVPDRAEAWDALGVSLLLMGDPANAEAAFTEAERLAPAVVDYALHRAEAAHAAGDGAGALARLDAALMQDPLDAPALGAHGLLAACQGDHAAAADDLEGAAALRPESAALLVVLARSWAALQQPAKAEALLARAIALNPADVQARSDRAVMLLRLQRPAEACAVLLELLEEQGPKVGALCNLANAYLASGEQDRAARAASDAIALAPDAHLPRRILCNVLPYHAGTGGAALLEAARAAAARLPRQDAPAWANAPEPGRALRLGLLSGSFKIHPVGWLTLAGLESLDPRQFEITCLAHGTAEDAMARRFRAVAAEWRDVSGLTTARWRDIARALGIDI